MKERIMELIKEKDSEIIVFDIDGTLKDLIAEHTEALNKVLRNCIRWKELRKKLVLWLDRISMWFVKAGILRTNQRMQNILLTIYAIILGRNAYDFRELYKIFYEQENVLFSETKELLEQLSKSKEVYFVTINKQNYNLESQGINADRIIYTMSGSKKKAYQRLFKSKQLDKSKVVIIGDNLFDDVFAARKLGVKSVLVDNYNSKCKRFIANMLNVGM